jgi:hypothetical protein
MITVPPVSFISPFISLLADALKHPKVNDVCVHPNQGELISCDQAGCIKQWDLSENLCSHELVCSEHDCSHHRLTYPWRHLQAMFLSGLSAWRLMALV